MNEFIEEFSLAQSMLVQARYGINKNKKPRIRFDSIRHCVFPFIVPVCLQASEQI